MDDIHYQMLKNLPVIALDTLSRVFIDHWTIGLLPSAWSEATIIPIPKPGEGSYLFWELQTNCTDTLFMQDIWTTRELPIGVFLTEEKITTDYQSGFRKSRSKTDQLVKS